ncbi:MAG: hypothetical protein ACPL3C_08330 [Pyrobaculum sp.]
MGRRADRPGNGLVLPPMSVQYEDGTPYLYIYTNDVSVDCGEGVVEYMGRRIRVGKCEEAERGKSHIKLSLEPPV